MEWGGMSMAETDAKPNYRRSCVLRPRRGRGLPHSNYWSCPIENFEQLSPLSSENSTSTHTSQFTVARILVIGLSCWLFRLRGPSVFARRCHPTHYWITACTPWLPLAADRQVCGSIRSGGRGPSAAPCPSTWPLCQLHFLRSRHLGLAIWVAQKCKHSEQKMAAMTLEMSQKCSIAGSRHWPETTDHTIPGISTGKWAAN